MATLSSLHLLHPAAIPFENLDPLLRRPVRLDLESLQQKLVEGHRGGYCYEHNILFAATLKQSGVCGAWPGRARALERAGGRASTAVAHGAARRSRRPTYVADVGFGGLTLTAPLRLEARRRAGDAARDVPPHRLGEDVAIQADIRGSWKTMYRFSGEEHLLPDYEMANWYTSTNPRSVFVTSLMAARVTGGPGTRS